MKAEQSTSSRFQLKGTRNSAELKMHIRMRVIPSGKLGGLQVGTWLSYEPKILEGLLDEQDVIHSALYNGVHGGLALAENSLGECIIEVQIIKLTLSKSLLKKAHKLGELNEVASILSGHVAGTIYSMWRSLSALGKPMSFNVRVVSSQNAKTRPSTVLAEDQPNH